ncbi:winged helix-turn-helix domain-containing protein [Paraburkholderia fungorum]|uniref:ATP-binding protein n=1 Tax=Paraburkholderia fungorum TaxID=134537 RepID=UPI0038BD9580
METRTLQIDDFSFGATVVVPRRRELTHNGVKVEIGGRAFDLLLALVEARGSILSKDQLISLVWQNRIIEENTLEGQVSVLRRMLGEDRVAIRTVAGRGYQFIGEVNPKGSTTNALPTAPALAPVLHGVRLPANISPIIGREKALHEVAEVALSRRLITLVGSGGVGKTRLAVEAARQLAPHFTDGVYLAELAAAASADYLSTTLAVALGFPPGDGTPSLDRMAASLYSRHLLLVLDNCEHLIESAAQITETLLRVAPRATILATSREPLRVGGEYVYRVPSLEVPPDDSVDDPREFGAIRLFEERIGTDILCSGKSTSALPLKVRICRQLDGIPLAIELAAACVPVVGLQGVADRLDDRFQLLTQGARTALPRQQTLRATLDWSYSLLAETQRTALNRLSLFAGPFSLESAQAVTSSEEIPPHAVMDVIIELVNKSLVSTVPSDGRIKYRLLETTRAYAYDKLRASGTLREWSSRHANHFLDIFVHAEQQAAAHVDLDWNTRYTPHLPDLRAAIRWAFSAEGDPSLAVDLTIASIPLSMQLALLEECLARVDRALEWLVKNGECTDERAMKLLSARGMSLLCHTVAAQTSDAFEAALELATQTGSAAYQLLAMWGAWMCLYLNGKYAQAEPLAQKFSAVAMASEWPCDRLAAYRLTGMSRLFRGELNDAYENLELAANSRAQLPRAQRIRFLYDEKMLSHAALAHTLWYLGRPEQATFAAQQSLDDARELDHPVSLCYALSEAVCTLALLTGDHGALDHAVSQMAIETRRHGISTWNARAQMWQGFMELLEGRVGAYEQKIYPALVGIGSKRFYVSLTPFLTATARLLAKHDRTVQAVALIHPAVERALETQDECSLPELLRAKAELMLGSPDPVARSAAGTMLADALERARSRRFLAWELRCATTLAQLKQHERKAKVARDLLTPVYQRFGEGFETLDLKAARVLLESL